jgi:adenine-specific DNA-methyltransferase
MPTLDWIGKKSVINHHREVPYHLLRSNQQFGVTDLSPENLLVQGDNLVALKALLPYYAGRVKCIYIDPPFNSGEQRWTYSDHVDSPEIRRWLGKTVGRETEDLSRHDKWLCMMYPRMKLLVKFLRRDGLLFISLDDTELARFRLMMDEIMPPSRFVTSLVWKSRRNLDSRHNQKVSIDHEYVLVYQGGEARFRGAVPDMSKYSNPDNDPRGPWMSDNLVGLATRDRRPNLHYELIDPATGIVYPCPAKGWRYSPETMASKIEDGRVLWPKRRSGRPRHKKFLADLQDEFTGFSSLVDCGNTNEGTEEVQRIMGSAPFIFPKPRSLIENLVEQATDEGDIVLDSFAGSGTTGHAVLSLNHIDGKRRQFILVEIDPDIASEITSERLRRVISGYQYSNAQGLTVQVEGLGGGFSYCALSEPLFDEAGLIGQSVTFEDLAAHVFFTETGTPLLPSEQESSPLLGIHNGTAVYLLFNGILGDKSVNGGNVLTTPVLRALPTYDGPKVIYGEGNRLGTERLKREGITFKQIPYQIKVS